MKINYKLNGNKDETVLFLHGWGANLNSFSFFSKQLNGEYSTLQVDFSGFGESEKLKYAFTVFDYAFEIFKLLKTLNINSIIIIAHSFGVRVAILLETMFNLNVKKMIFIGGAGVKPKFNIIKTFKIYNYKFAKFLNKTKLFKINLNKFGSLDYKQLNSIQKQTFLNIVNFDETNLLKQISSKTLLIWGEEDKETPVYMAKIMNKKIKNSKLIIVKNAGHFCFSTHSNFVLFHVKNFLLN